MGFHYILNPPRNLQTFLLYIFLLVDRHQATVIVFYHSWQNDKTATENALKSENGQCAFALGIHFEFP